MAPRIARPVVNFRASYGVQPASSNVLCTFITTQISQEHWMRLCVFFELRFSNTKHASSRILRHSIQGKLQAGRHVRVSFPSDRETHRKASVVNTNGIGCFLTCHCKVFAYVEMAMKAARMLWNAIQWYSSLGDSCHTTRFHDLHSSCCSGCHRVHMQWLHTLGTEQHWARN